MAAILCDTVIAIIFMALIVPMSNTTSHDNQVKIYSWVSFSFLYYMGIGAPLGSPSEVLWAMAAPL